jgi:hypothetical protein
LSHRVEAERAEVRAARVAEVDQQVAAPEVGVAPRPAVMVDQREGAAEREDRFAG